MGSGKTYVSNLLTVVFDIPVYNTDLEVKRILNENAELKSKLTEKFGVEIYLKDGTWNRPAVVRLAQKEGPEVLDRIGEIIDPYMMDDIRAFKSGSHPRNPDAAKVVGIESAILAKSKPLMDEVTAFLLVTAPLETRIARIKKRDPYRTDDEIVLLLQNQKDKLPRVDYVISNGDRDEADIKLAEIVEKIIESNLNS